VTTLVTDASIAVKWVVEEDGTSEALTLRRRASKLIAPEFLVAECANILCKKVQRDELFNDEALLAAQLLQAPRSSFCRLVLFWKRQRRLPSSSTMRHMIAFTSHWHLNRDRCALLQDQLSLVLQLRSSLAYFLGSWGPRFAYLP
jgi:hypothetical protein